MTWRLSIHDELPSTQDLVLTAAQDGEAGGLAVLARRQSAGRGTQGRPWRSPQGNLFLSVLLRPAGPARDLPQWSLLAGLAVADTISAYLPDPAALRLKWPNDVLLDGAKAAGILTQGQPDAAGGIAWLVFGIGVNLAEAPVLPDRPTASLAQHAGQAPEPVAFAWALLARLDHWRARQEAEGFAPIRAAWVARGPALQAPLALQRPEGRMEGLYQGLTEDGRLLLCSKDGPIVVASGEIAG
ncbi:biotin--[acetyl-CoA-carboxylase] ligase [Pseudoroseomonas cervicalis]|uniref:biotin--[acetyl-CoA-carboxylase] ligase n=1 Tax=Teichococcus cervicalis TaxID=204525 RepID=UPI002785F7C3|nr:biotin--[acetyl-CoA-carboxylase] ligase [Pseudoroseomonas cervicalis]MDQ1078668.1 BirA family biotin operon repressor/biotin-[acetyl-CoA-carboxylase] ligase [Pseudoroseomonas cervicalis]